MRMYYLERACRLQLELMKSGGADRASLVSTKARNRDVVSFIYPSLGTFGVVLV